MYTITLPGGKVLSGLGLNGNNFVSREAVSAGDFEHLPGAVEIAYDGDAPDVGGLTGTHACMELVQVKKYADGWYFILRDVEATEYERLASQIEYLAMMMEVEL